MHMHNYLLKYALALYEHKKEKQTALTFCERQEHFTCYSAMLCEICQENRSGYK